MSTNSAKFGSVRYKSRPIVRRPSFRDDTNLVAVRYEKTAQGEAPIPIPTRNPSRTSRPASSSSSSTSYRPVVVIPPSGAPASPQAPPNEEHPALRQGPVLQWTGTGPKSDRDWKRDSGHASASCPSSTPTIDEEDCEHEFPPYSPSTRAVSPVVRHSRDARPADVVTIDTDYASVYSDEPKSISGSPIADFHAHLNHKVNVENGTAHLSAESSPYGRISTSSVPEQSRPQTPLSTPSSPPSPQPAEGRRPRKPIVKSFSFRSVASSLIRTDSVLTRGSGRGEDSKDRYQSKQGQRAGFSAATSPNLMDVPPREPLLRGLPSPKSTNNQPTYPDGPNQIEELSPEQNRRSPRSAAISTLWRRGQFHLGASPRSRRDTKADPDNSPLFAPLSVTIPTDSLLDDDFLNDLSFSKRGSVLFGGRRLSSLNQATMDTEAHRPSDGTDAETNTRESATTLNATPEATSTSLAVGRSSNDSSNTGYVTPDAEPTSSAEPMDRPPQQLEEKAQQPAPPPDIRVMPADIDRESQKVRSLYLGGSAIDSENGPRPSLGDRREPPIEEASGEDEGEPSPQPAHQLPAANTTESADSSSLLPPDALGREPKLLGGGYEDWDDLDGAFVDRYGFITNSRPTSSRLGTPTDSGSAQFHPRRRNVLQKRVSPSALGDMRPPSRKVSARSLNTHHSGLSTTSFKSSRSVIRQAGNLLPHNRDRRWMDEAGDMLSSSPSLQDIAEEARLERIAEALKRKEWERAEKWQRMAKKVKKGTHGEGMEFEFDTKNPKLIERTWKGIPDRWRSSAWWSFMAASAKAVEGSPTDQAIIADFHKLQGESSPDDVQIDLDVPRTISRHIMFRRRYEGGQRLLFRVLHALSIYFPETGYVQGMASLAATLLCYFDEEKCFVMLVRMWRLRGLDRLYAHGFEGLMTALNEFETTWLNKDVAKKLSALGIDATAYGTRWYLTLFNLSIPFPAQLRVWDVFLLLGTNGSLTQGSASASNQPTNSEASETPTASAPQPTGLDILHATSAALIQALREILIDSDFENAMKSLTSSIPIRDEDLLMRVSKAEWKSHQGKRKA